MPYCSGEIEYCPAGCQWCGRNVPVRIANKLTQWSMFAHEQRNLAYQIEMGVRPGTAIGFQLDKILEVMDLEKRGENETDVEVRERIYDIFRQGE